MNGTVEITLGILVATAAATDLQSRRIPNWLNLSGLLAGFSLNAACAGLAGLQSAAYGMLLGFGVYLVLYCLHAMGAGDVKLMAAVGSLLGPAGWLQIFVYSALAGGLFALVLVVMKRRVRETLWNIGYILYEMAHFRLPFWRRSHLDVQDKRSLKLPHGVAIAAGTAACLLLAKLP